ncbi:hypothetical protein Mapa_003539 [Marchantia paleacea]|nr:hypothetical protein Mapa_003539 [Marchantia paleacea]
MSSRQELKTTQFPTYKLPIRRRTTNFATDNTPQNKRAKPQSRRKARQPQVFTLLHIHRQFQLTREGLDLLDWGDGVILI